MVKFDIGCSGFSYKEWKDVFYPAEIPQKKWFEYYCTQFSTLELNVTFYNFPKLAYLQQWHLRSPDNFSFAVKAPRLITHYKKFLHANDLIAQFYDIISHGLQQKLACALFQLPASFIYSEEHLEVILDGLNASFINVVEFRHNSWWQDKVYKALATKNITFCSMSHPSLPDEVIKNTATVYYRFHGAPRLYYSSYSKAYLQNIISQIKQSKKLKNAYTYFNNTALGHAVQNAKKMISLV